MITNSSEFEIKGALETIKKAKRIAIIPHRAPDGDAIGAAVAVKLALKQLGKKPRTICIDPPPKYTDFLPETDLFEKELKLDEHDLLIFVDCGAHYMSKFHERIPNLFDGHMDIINIDHHGSNDFFGMINIVEPQAASTTQILYELFRKWGIELSKEISTCLMTGLYFDTGSFRNTNTTPDVLKIAGDLLAKGADYKTISKEIFQTKSSNKLKLWGKALSNIKKTDKAIVTSAITNDDYSQCETDSKDLEGVIDYLNAIPESKFCMLLSEDQKGGVKASMRTQREDVDLSKIAEVFGGGGHKMASGFRIEGNLKEEKYWSIN